MDDISKYQTYYFVCFKRNLGVIIFFNEAKTDHNILNFF